MILTSSLLFLVTGAVSTPALSAPERGAVAALRSMRAAEPMPTSFVIDRLATEIGVTDFLVGLLGARSLPALEAEGEEQALNVFQENAILAALEQHAVPSVQAAVEALLAEEPALSQRRAAILVLGRTGGALDAVVDVLTSADSGSNSLERAFVTSVAGMLEHDPAVLTHLTRTWRDLPEDVAPLLVRAVGEARDHHALTFLTDVATWRSDLDVLVLTQIPLLGGYLPELTEGLDRVVRGALTDSRPMARRSALAALEAIGDVTTVETLIELLDDEEVAVQAHRVLTATTEMNFPVDPAIWRQWFEGEQRWFAEFGDVVRRDLSSGNRARQMAGLRRVTHHPLFADRWGEAWQVLFDSADEIVRSAACTAATRVDARETVPALVGLLEHESEATRSRAHGALRELTAWRLPLDATTWRAAL